MIKINKITFSNFNKGIAIPLILIGVTTTAFAADDGFYAGLSLGNGKPNITSTTSLSKNSSFIYGGIVGYQFNKNFATEGQYTGVGQVTDTAGNTAKADAFSVSAVGILPLNESFNLYGKLGIASAKTTTSAGYSAFGTSRTALTYGVGVQYNATTNIGVRLGWDRYGIATASATGVKSNFNSDVLNVSAIYTF
ncbi:porin family protein [Sulfuriferula nivalis]|uniref:Outer membrane protein beta-barrel domain-containing protein n=1 Tax=Sulfuriferula nivalis TaxID=2675298 RepID=A0A809SH24_9PROT|nr:porin family protein [Sulfuriferula nivalis]BBP00430.1 hypothetical protein SFSGTM_11380 [Sulfuriferula nivalis]